MSKPGRLVVIGTNRSLRSAAGGAAASAQLEVVTYADVAEFVDEDHADGIGCILVALPKAFSGLGSIDALAPYVRRWQVILCAADVEVATVVAAMKWGAFDFLTTFTDQEQLSESIERALVERRRARQARRRLEQLQTRLGALTRREAAVLQVAMGSAPDPQPLLEALRPNHARRDRPGRAVNGRNGRPRPGDRAGAAGHALSKVGAMDELTPRLRQALGHLLQGDSEKQVASRMGLSRHTVHDYIKALHKHFGVNSRGELLAHCLTLPQQPPDASPDARIVC